MPIHIHLPNNKTTPLFTITDELHDALTSPFTTFEEKTSIFIDSYGDARLSHPHAGLLLKIITDEIANKQLQTNKVITDFTSFLHKLLTEKTDVELIGD
jgi:hypothetical protein